MNPTIKKGTRSNDCCQKKKKRDIVFQLHLALEFKKSYLTDDKFLLITRRT
jgi:hypothetical protein